MNDHSILGAIKEKAGVLEEGLGKVTGDKETELRGQTRQVQGKVENLFGRTIEEAQRFYKEHPLISILAAGAVAMTLLSALTGSDRD